MSILQLEQWLPQGCVVKGALLRKYDLQEDLALLDQDILEVDLPTGQTVDVGWFPQNRADGRFVVSIYRGHRINTIRKIEARTPHDVAAIIQQVAQDFAQVSPVRSGSTATNTNTTYAVDVPNTFVRRLAVG